MFDRTAALIRPEGRPVVGLVLAAVLLGGCGGSSGTTTTKVAANTTTSAPHSGTAGAGVASFGSPSPLAFAKCMRANGVAGFPDPSARGPLFDLGPGIDPSSPAFSAAHAKCQSLLPGSFGPGTTTHPSARTLRKLLRIADCMRQHGVAQFPDPRTSVPANLNPSVDAEVTNFDGAILLFPASLNLQAPAYRQALTACGAPPLGLHH